MKNIPNKTIMSTMAEKQEVMGASLSSSNNLSNMNVSPMMQGLNKAALIKARATIASKFADPMDLDELVPYMAQLQKNMSIAEAQLNGAVQGKMDALKRAVDIMDESAEKLAAVKGRIVKTEERIVQANTAISTFEYLRRVHNARDNLQKVITQVEFFARAPERVAALKDQLNNDPGSLKEVFLESLKLESLRYALFTELDVTKERRGSITGHSPMKTGNRANGTSHGDGTVDIVRVREAVDEHLNIVPDLLRNVHTRLFDNIANIWDLAADAPADLVTTFEVIEMYQEYVDRRALSDANSNNIGSKTVSKKQVQQPTAIGAAGLKDIKNEAKKRLKQCLEEKIKETFKPPESMTKKHKQNRASATTSSNNRKGKQQQRRDSDDDDEDDDENEEKEKESEVSIMLTSASHVVHAILLFKNEVSPCVPPDYDAMKVFVMAFERPLQDAVDHVVDGMHDLEVVEMLQLVDWLAYFSYQMAIFGFNDRPCLKAFETHCDELLSEYLDRIKTQVLKWFGNIKRQPLDIVAAVDKTLITSQPEDMFNIIHVQVEVAKEKLPAERLKDVVNACLQVLRDVQRQNYDQLSSTWRRMDPEMLCSVVNDNQRMQEKCEEFGDRMIKHVPQADQREVLTAMLEDISSEYVTFSVHAIGYLARSVLKDLEDPVFAQLFTAEWENNYGESLSSVIVATLQDYFQDVKVWLPDYFYCKFVKEVLFTLTGLYVMQLRRFGSSSGSGHYDSAIAAARKMMLDLDTFGVFFEEHAEELRRGGLKSLKNNSSNANDVNAAAITETLEPIANLATVCSRDGDKAFPRDDVVALFTRYGMDGQRLVLAAFSCNRGMTKAQRIERLDTTYKLFEKGSAAGAGSTTTNNSNNNKYSKVLSDVYKKIVDHPIERAPPTNTTTNNGANNHNTSSASKAKPINNATPAKSSFWG